MPTPPLLAPFSSRAADQRPHSFGVGDGDPNSLSPPDRTHLKNARIESAVSMGTSERIQQHLESGNAIYLGLDPRDDGRILRHSISGPDGMLRDFKFGSGYGPGRYPLFEKLLCGLSLDCVAKIALGTSLYLSGYTFLKGLTTFAGGKGGNDGFTFLVAVIQIVWGFYLGGVCIFGMSLMWGRWKRSPTATLLFTITWIFSTCLMVVTGAVWLYFFFSSRAERIANCKNWTVRVGPKNDFDAPRRLAPQERIDACISLAMKMGMGLLVYGISHLVMAILGLVVIAWGRDYRARLNEIKEFERLQDEWSYEHEKIGLVIGTVPIGIRGSRGTAKPTWEQHWRSNAGGDNAEDFHFDIEDEKSKLRDRWRQTDVSVRSGVLPFTARKSQLYGNTIPQVVLPPTTERRGSAIARVL